MTLKETYSYVIRTVTILISVVVAALVAVQVSVFLFSSVANKQTEINSLSNSIMHTNDNLIKLIRVYIINGDTEAFNTYDQILNDPESFNNKLTRMEEIGLDETEKRLTTDMLSTLDVLAGIEGEAIAFMEAGEHEQAISTLFSEAYVLADNQLAEQNLALIDHIDNRYERSKSMAQILVTVLLIITFLLLIATIIVTRRMQIWQRDRVLHSIQQIIPIADQIAIGNVDVTIKKDRDDEIGALIDSFNNMADSIRKQVEIVKHIANGNYVVDINIRSEHDALNSALKDMIEMTVKTLGQIQKSSQEVNLVTKNIQAGSDALAIAATNQLSSITDVSTIVSALSNDSANSAIHAHQAQDLVSKIRQESNEGNQAMQLMVDKMSEIQLATSGISDIMKSIETISSQTNLLALNASIEAARAGEHGKGFAVVADEVRALANQTRESVEQSASIISEVIQKTNEGTQMTQRVESVLTHIVSGVNTISEVVGTISSALGDQSKSIADINQSIHQITDLIQDVSASAQESAASNSILKDDLDELNRLIALYKI